MVYKNSLFYLLLLYTMRKHIRKSHNVTMLLYHLVFPVKYRRKVFTTQRIEQVLIDECKQIEKYEIYFDSIGIDWDHVHLLVQSIPTLCVSDIVMTVKSITAKVLLQCKIEIAWKLWWWEFWTDGYYANTVWVYAWFQTIQHYVQNQWRPKNEKQEYKQVYISKYSVTQQSLFW